VKVDAMRRAAMFGGLLFILWGETTHRGITGLHGSELLTSIALAVSSIGWVCWAIAGPLVTSLPITIAVCVTGVSGSLLLVVHPAVAVCWFAFWACVAAGFLLPYRIGMALAAGCCGILVAGYLAKRGDTLATLAAVSFVAYVIGLNRQQATRAAGLDERTRLARELHDILGHSLTALSLQIESASAALESGDDKDRALEHLAKAAVLVRSGQEEAVAAVRTLRDGSVGVHEIIKGLVSASGLDVELTCDGPARELPATTGMVICRVVQEGLTNAGKHAPGAPVAVRLSYQPDALSVTVVNGTAVAVTSIVTGGQGLRGMRERVTAAGGTFDAGETGAGWRVEATVPA
jgi:signal transduction histidine kinase